MQSSDPELDLSSEDSYDSYEQSSSESESQYADISGLLMVQPSTKTEEPSTSTPIVDESNDDQFPQILQHLKPLPNHLQHRGSHLMTFLAING